MISLRILAFIHREYRLTANKEDIQRGRRHVMPSPMTRVKDNKIVQESPEHSVFLSLMVADGWWTTHVAFCMTYFSASSPLWYLPPFLTCGQCLTTYLTDRTYRMAIRIDNQQAVNLLSGSSSPRLLRPSWQVLPPGKPIVPYPPGKIRIMWDWVDQLLGSGSYSTSNTSKCHSN